jgi:hypothetical protein
MCGLACAWPAAFTKAAAVDDSAAAGAKNKLPPAIGADRHERDRRSLSGGVWYLVGNPTVSGVRAALYDGGLDRETGGPGRIYDFAYQREAIAAANPVTDPAFDRRRAAAGCTGKRPWLYYEG